LNQQHIYTLIQKYRDNTATAAEKDELLQWYRQTAYQDADFPEMEDSVGESMLARLNGEIKPAKTSAPYVRWLAAASVILLLGVTGLLISRAIWPAENTANTTAFNNILPGSNKAILTLANGTRISLSDAVNGTISNQHGIQITKAANGQLIYTIKATTEAGSEALTAFNTIETPRGGQYQIVLPDGSKVWLNASSSLKFPVNFSLHKERRVALAGEAYFEVAHNADKPFRVATDKQLVEVLGTHFNINAYTDEPGTKTSLLQGKVKITAGTQVATLAPGQQASLTNNITVTEANTSDAIAWKNGYFNFDDEKLESIMRSVSRWYDVDVVFEDESLKSETFGAVTTRFSNIAQLLKIMEQTGDASFGIDGKTIRISRKK